MKIYTNPKPDKLIDQRKGSCPCCSAPVSVSVYQPFDPEIDGAEYETYEYDGQERTDE